jgi:hypothetical protein
LKVCFPTAVASKPAVLPGFQTFTTTHLELICPR